MFNTDKDALTIQEVEKYIDTFKVMQLPRLQKLKRYYDCKNDKIMNKTYADTTKANNKAATPYASYISNVLSGYFNLGGVTYTSMSNLIDVLNDIYLMQDEHTKNNQLALDASIYGVAYELLYLNEFKEIAFDTLDPRTVVTIYDNTIEQELKFAIRFWTTKEILTGEEITHIEVYSKKEIAYFVRDLNGIRPIGMAQHYFNKCPVNVYRNTKGFAGDFEKVIALVDAYDEAISQTLNFREDLNNSYLVFKNTNLDNEDIQTMREARVIQIEDCSEGSASNVQWLTKDTVDAENENLKVRLAADIEKFSYISELALKSHTTATGASMQLISLESVCQQKEHYAKKALMNRIVMICNYLKVLGENYEPTDITMTFNRNMPLDLNVTADIVSKLAPFVSKETLLAQLPFINDVQVEIDKINKESEVNSYSNFLLEGGENE